jgi:predicted phosphoribosyltransferase
VLVLLRSVIDEFKVPDREVTRIARKQTLALIRRERAYRGERDAISLVGRTVILVDDGLSSVTMPLTAIAAIRARAPERLVIATPVARAESQRDLRGLVDDFVCLEVPTPFHNVRTWYRDFPAVSDLDVRRLHAQSVARTQHWFFLH